MSFSNLERKILEVIAFFDLFSYPLTSFQIWKNLRTAASYGEVHEVLLNSLYLGKRLEAKGGKWYLKGSEKALVQRATRYRFSKRKFSQAHRFVRLLRWCPWIQAVYACNSLGFLHAREDSDIDLFVVVRRGRIWISRFITVLLARIVGHRPSSGHKKNGLCLSFFAAENARMESLALSQDIYFVYWMSKLLPLFVRRGVAEKFWAQNKWLKRELPQMEMVKMPRTLVFEGKGEKVNTKLGNFMEKFLHKLQIWIMPVTLKETAKDGTAVVLNDEFLKFHDHDKREYFREEYAKRLDAILA